ncbi:MAG: hypothetical protein HY664_02480 [Chloroflexi bacterium]|nr:hypothetical protein [Chloroflexota bacterium]
MSALDRDGRDNKSLGVWWQLYNPPEGKEIEQRKPSKEGERLGEILVGAGLIDQEELKTALVIGRQQGKRLGEVLVEQKLVTPFNIAKALQIQKERWRQSGNMKKEMVVTQPSLIDELSSEGTPPVGGWGYLSAFKVVGENTPEATVDAVLSVKPAQALLNIKNTISPEVITDGVTTPVTYRFVVRNVGAAAALDVVLVGDGLPHWFEMAEIKVDDEPLNQFPKEGEGLPLGDIPVGGSKIVTISGTAFPHGEKSNALVTGEIALSK